MFLKFYLALSISILSSVLASYASFTALNHWRSLHYVEVVHEGTFRLIQEGLSRHESNKRDAWLEIVSRISGMDLQLRPLADAPLSPEQKKALENGQFLIRPDGDPNYTAFIGHSIEPLVLSAQIEGLSEQQLRASALLIINDLKRFKTSERDQQIERLRRLFGWDIQVTKLEGLTQLDRSQLRRLNNGAIVVGLSPSSTGGDAHSIFARITNRGEDVLVLGPISSFETTPDWLLISLISFNILMLGATSYFMIRRLELRVSALSMAVKDFGKGQLDIRSATEGGDTIAVLADNFNRMAEQIGSLLDEQKHLIQAISHELRTPMSRMKFRLDMLEQQLSEPAEQERIIGLRRDLKELNQLVDETLFYHALEEGKPQSPEMTEVNVQMLIQDLQNKLELELSGKGFSATVVPTSLITIYALPDEFKRLVQNLLSNALKHCEHHVQLNLSENANAYELIVSDDGHGIPEADWSKVFEAYSRLDNSRNKKTGGYGLGLAIVDRIARLHKGSVTVGSSELGGACFTFVWPKH